MTPQTHHPLPPFFPNQSIPAMHMLQQPADTGAALRGVCTRPLTMLDVHCFRALSRLPAPAARRCAAGPGWEAVNAAPVAAAVCCCLLAPPRAFPQLTLTINNTAIHPCFNIPCCASSVTSSKRSRLMTQTYSGLLYTGT